MPPSRYPPAEWRGNGQSGGSWVTGPYRVVLHTTETRVLPGYQNGASAPHLTYSPASRRWWQHTALDRAARALRNQAGGVETNRHRSLQVEIICYSDRATAERVHGLWVGDLPDSAYTDIVAFCRWTAEHYGIKPAWPGRTAHSYAAANAGGFRLNGDEWQAFAGVCSHQHVPENTHWDTGALDLERIVTLMKEDTTMDPDAVRAVVREELAKARGEIAAAVWGYKGRFATDAPAGKTATAATALSATEQIVRRLDKRGASGGITATEARSIARDEIDQATVTIKPSAASGNLAAVADAIDKEVTR